jgi:RNA polymerase sigma-70 factor, ECF subfamily
MSSEEGSPGALGQPSERSSAPEQRKFLRQAYLDHRSEILELALRVCGADRAAEVTQEVFLRLWKHPEHYEASRGSLRAYLLASAHDVAIDFLRGEIARHKRDAPGHRASDSPDSALDSELYALEASARIAEALASLDAGERDAILSAFYGQVSYRAVASASGLPPEAIASRIRAGLLRMEKALRKSGTMMLL